MEGKIVVFIVGQTKEDVVIEKRIVDLEQPSFSYLKKYKSDEEVLKELYQHLEPYCHEWYLKLLYGDISPDEVEYYEEKLENETAFIPYVFMKYFEKYNGDDTIEEIVI